jgi:hypothetical protein
MEEEKLHGKLFNSIPLLSEDHFDTLYNNMNEEFSKYILIQAVKHAYHSGVFSIGETEIISKSIRVLSKEKINNT